MLRRVSLAASALALAAGLTLNPAPAAAQRAQAVTCQSTGYDRTYCNADTRYGVRISQQYSESACVEGRTWGSDRRGIWVSRGCRAQFVVGGSQNSNGRWNDPRDNRRPNRNEARNVENQVERVCRNTVRSRFRNVSNRDIDVNYQGRTRNGGYIAAWRTGRSNGSCRVNAQGQLMNFRIDRR